MKNITKTFGCFFPPTFINGFFDFSKNLFLKVGNRVLASRADSKNQAPLALQRHDAIDDIILSGGNIMESTQKRATIYLAPVLHKALKLKLDCPQNMIYI